MHNTHLVDTAELEIAVEVHFVEGLHPWVEQPAQQRVLFLLHDLRACAPRIMLRHLRAHLEIIPGVLFRVLERRSLDESQLRGGDAEGLEDGKKDVLVVLAAVLNELEGSFHVVKEGMNV